MGIDKYRVTTSPFDRYYDTFLQNSLRGRPFKIVLASGDEALGVPTSGSIVNPLDPNVSFAFRTGDGSVYRIPFADLREAVPVGEPVSCAVRTIDPYTLGASDFEVVLEEPETERLLTSEAETSVVRGTLRRAEDFVDGAPPDTYKFLTVRGAEFRIARIERGKPPTTVSLTVTRL